MRKKLFFMFTATFLIGSVHVVNAQDLPEPWTSTDIGTVTGGSATYDEKSETITLTGSGINFWETEDAHFAYVEIVGDFEFEVRVITFQSENAMGDIAITGINARNSLETDAPSITMAWQNYGGLSTVARKAAGETPTWVGGTQPGYGAIPWYLKVTRVGDEFSTFESPDKSEWTNVDNLNFSNMDSIIYVGLVMCPASEGAASATFDGINITGSIKGDPTGIRAQMNVANKREVYPNPAQDNLYVSLAQAEHIKQLSVIDVTGSVVFRSSDSFNNNLVNVSSLKPGLYFLNVVTNKTTTTSKFFKK